MSFALKIYWLFLLVVVIVYWLLPVRGRKAWLLVTSIGFYATWSVPYVALLMGAAALNHFGAKWMVAGDRNRRGKIVVAGNLVLLAVFKYLAWILGMFTSVGAWFGVSLSPPIPHWALPLGISFYLFESISYIVDVMRKRESVHSFWDIQLFLAYFPKLLAGPILRASEFLPQIDKPRPFQMSLVREALREIIIGLFIKLMLADALGARLDPLYGRPAESLRALDAWVMGIGFGLQVYLDFSAYTRMASGSAKLCGINLVPNFNHPFISTSPAEFWNRWHMSLSRWVRDYLFYPMAQRRLTLGSSPNLVKLGRVLVLMWAAFFSMLIFGIWHGAAWTFVAYGAYHGAVLALYQLKNLLPGANKQPLDGWLGRLLTSLRSLGGWVLTTALVSLGFLVARAKSFSDGLVLIDHALHPFKYSGVTAKDFVVFRTLGLFLLVVAVGYFARRKELKREPPKPDTSGYGFALLEGLGLGIILVLTILDMSGNATTFVYFQF